MLGRQRKMTPTQKREMLGALGQTVAKRRDEAVQARRESGIEEIWMECEEAYLGMDDSNRHEFHKARWAKPTSIDGPVTTGDSSESDNRSTAFVRLTSRYVDFASAKLAEIALPIDDKAFSFEPTPIPEPAVAPAPQAEAPAALGPQDGGAAGIQPVEQAGGDIEALIEQAKESAKKADRRIFDWLVESKYPREMRKVINDAARIGTGVLKGPIPDVRREQAVTMENGTPILKILDKTVPVVRWTDPWNIFPDPACGEDIHDGDYILERDYISPKRLRGLKRRRGWKKDQIDKVLREGPGKIYLEDGDEKHKKTRFERWQYYGSLSREDLEAAEVKGLPEECDEAYAIITLINDTVVRCILNPLDSGRFPYHAMQWSRRSEHWAGVGVGEQVAMPQRMVNAGTRALLENAGLSAGIQIILDQGSVTPADGTWEIVRNKVWLKSTDTIIDDVRKAFHVFEFPNIQAQLMPIIEYAMRLAEEHSSIPLVTQGNYVESASPQTFGQAELQNNNAHALLREKGASLDDCVTEPMVGMMYEWLLLDPDVPDDEKGDFQINANGTAAMVERAIQEMTLMQMISVATNPGYGADPKKLFKLLLRAKRMDPRDVLYTDEELEQMQGQQQGDPRIEAANIAAQSRVQAAQIAAEAGVQKEGIKAKVSLKKMVVDTDRDVAFIQEQRARSRETAEYNMAQLQVKRELALLDYANRRNITVDQIRGRLTETKAKLTTQKALAASTAVPPQVVTPPTEPPGHAPDGQAYER